MQREEIYQFFAKKIEEMTGIVYSSSNFFQLETRLNDVAKFLGLNSIEALYEQAQTGIGGAFHQYLLDISTNNETSFFRDTNVFRNIEATILAKKPKHLRIWSAACSSGQEPLSLAMTIMEWSAKNDFPISFQILATDISDRILSRAKSGVYSQLEVQRGLPAPLLVKYFGKNEKDQWCVQRELLQKIEFQEVNLLAPLPFREKFDLILCRNVLIYQTVERKIDILNRISDVLHEDGHLILGSGESMIGLSDKFNLICVNSTVLYSKKIPAPAA